MNSHPENDKKKSPADNADLQGNDKSPGEEKGKKEKLTMDDLKGKKVDGDPSLEEDQPMQQKK